MLDVIKAIGEEGVDVALVSLREFLNNVSVKVLQRKDVEMCLKVREDVFNTVKVTVQQISPTLFNMVEKSVQMSATIKETLDRSSVDFSPVQLQQYMLRVVKTSVSQTIYILEAFKRQEHPLPQPNEAFDLLFKAELDAIASDSSFTSDQQENLIRFLSDE